MGESSVGEFAVKLNQARLSRGLSIRAVARIAGVPSATAQGWLSGKHFPVSALRPQYLKVVEELGLIDDLPESLAFDTWHEIRPALRKSYSPYLGLRPFGVGDGELFFGRSAEATRIAEAVKEMRDSEGHGMLAVVGPSGAGKSSVLAAGLVASECVSGILSGCRAQFISGADELDQVRDETELLVVDQFEDVLSLDLPSRRREILIGLAELAMQRVVVLGLRSDAFATASLEPSLTEALSHPILLAPLSRAELREVITGPADLRGVVVEEQLVVALEHELAPGPDDESIPNDVLPLLSNALMVTWAAGSGKRMLLQDYKAVGGLSAATETLAEEVYTNLDEAQQARAKALFLRLVKFSGDSVLRESLPLSEVGAAAEVVLDAFVSARMLTVSADRVRISHDALIRHWSRLKEWVAESRTDLERLDSLRRATQLWVESDRDEAALIPVQRLAAFSSWFDEPSTRELLGPAEKEFLDASDARSASELAQERRANGRLRRRGRIAMGLAAATTALAVISATLYLQGQDAQAQAQSRQVAVASQTLRTKDPNLMTQMAAVSVALADTQEARSAAVNATSVDAPLRWNGEPSGVLGVSQDAQVLARGGGSGVVSLWRSDALDKPGSDVTVDPTHSALWAVAVTKVGDRVLLAVGGKSVRSLWDITDTPRQLADLRDDDLTTYSAAFDSDGKRVLFGTQSGALKIWNLENLAAPRQEPALQLQAGTDGEASAAVSIAISADHLVFAGGVSGKVSRWHLDQGVAHPLPSLDSSYVPTGGTESVSVVDQALALSPDGKHLAAGKAGRAAITWEVNGETVSQPTVLRAFKSWVNTVSYSSDSAQLVVGASDQDVSIYATASGLETRRMVNSSIITGAAILDGRPVAVGSDGGLRVWPAASPVLRAGGGLASYNLATDGSSSGWLVAGNVYSSPNVWKLTDGVFQKMPDLTVSLPAGDSQRGALAVSPQGNFVAEGTDQGRVVSWPLSAGKVGPASVIETDLGFIETVKMSPSGSLVAGVEDEGSHIALFRADAKGVLSPAALIPAEQPSSAAFCSDTLLATAPGDGRVALWDVSDATAPRQLAVLDGIAAEAHLVASSGHLLAVGDSEGIVSVWDVADPAQPTKLREFRDAGGSIYAIDLSADGQHLIATAADDLIWGWNLADGSDEPAYVLTGDFGRAWDALFVDDGRQIAITGNSGEIKLWAATVPQSQDRLCANRGAPLTDLEWERYLPGVAKVDPC